MRLPICRSDWLAAWPIGEIGRLADWMLPSGALEVTKVLLFIVFPIRFAFSTCRSYQICYAFPSCALEVTKVLLFIVSTRLAPSKLPKSRHFLSLLSCAFEVTKVSEFIVFSIRLAPSRSPKCRHFHFPLPPALSKLPESFIIYRCSSRLAPSKLPKCQLLSRSFPVLCRRNTKVSLFLVFPT